MESFILSFFREYQQNAKQILTVFVCGLGHDGYVPVARLIGFGCVILKMSDSESSSNLRVPVLGRWPYQSVFGL